MPQPTLAAARLKLPEPRGSRERRRFERVVLPDGARVLVENEHGKRVGRVRNLSRGGMLLAPERMLFTPGNTYTLYLVDHSEGVLRRVRCIMRYQNSRGVGFEFQHLELDAAVDIGILAAKYYSRQV